MDDHVKMIKKMIIAKPLMFFIENTLMVYDSLTHHFKHQHLLTRTDYSISRVYFLCLATSNINTDPATPALSDSTFPAMGIQTL
jgi:hypothetical protein